ncbi:MAG: glycosyltransferase family 2 protein [Acidobacteria bacterium]|nr:MAG: glycosyltransferase family 2 protein [Acidobacteriota bacterium]RPJ87507.1 MAG: glycosyltransferase family 2 protein [Acidobacteriota bacterium]
MSESTDLANRDRVLSVIIPAFNEEATIQAVVEKASRLPFVLQVIVVDDGSTDSTPDILSRLDLPNVLFIRQPRNLGKTAAIKRALLEVQGDVTVFQDADLEYDPDEIQHVIRPIMENQADVVYGSRFLVRRSSRVLYFYHYLANKTLTFLSNLFTNVNMTDIETCYKAFRSRLIKTMPLTSSGFGMEVEITAMISKTHARIYEVPISYHGRTYREGKKIQFRDGLIALWYIFHYNTPFTGRSVSRRTYVREANVFLDRLVLGAAEPSSYKADHSNAHPSKVSAAVGPISRWDL